MCGIGGIKGHILSTEKNEIFPLLAKSLVSRGDQATGLGWYSKSGEPLVLKSPVSPIKVDYQTLFNFSCCSSETIMFHNRLATRGKPEVNKNNHPFKGNGYLLAHNGCIRNVEAIEKMFDLKDYNSEPETDSYVLVKAINKLISKRYSLEEALSKVCEKVSGSMVLTVLAEDNTLYLVHGDTYDFNLYSFNDKEYIYASSNKMSYYSLNSGIEAIDEVVTPLLPKLYNRFMKSDGYFKCQKHNFPTGSIVKIDDNGISVSSYLKNKKED